MLTIKNVRLANGRLVKLNLAKGFFHEVVPQAHGHEAANPLDLTLEQYLTLSQKQPLTEGSVDAKAALFVPAGVDVHVHSRDPGHPQKEDWHSLSLAAFKGGVAAVVDMPNTKPPTLTRRDLEAKMTKAATSPLQARFLMGVTPSNLADLTPLLADTSLPLAGLKVYYGQSTGDLLFQDLDLIAQAMPAHSDKICVFHSEDQCRIEERLPLGQHLGERVLSPAEFSIHSHIRDSKAAWIATRQILAWAEKQPFKIHLAHVSTPDELELLQASRARGKQVTAEVSPHHLLFSSRDYEQQGAFLKVNPPVRGPEEVSRLRHYVHQGMVDCFATDHAPHTRAEKALPYHQCPSGIPALEFFWPLLCHCAAVCKVPLASFLPLGTSSPAALFGFPRLGQISAGFAANFVWLKEGAYTLTAEAVAAKCGWSPYVGMSLPARVAATWINGLCVYRADTVPTPGVA